MRTDSREYIIARLWDDKGFEAGYKQREEIVRCRDCKNWNEWENGVGSCHRSENRYNWFGTNMNDYCSFGERREP